MTYVEYVFGNLPLRESSQAFVNQVGNMDPIANMLVSIRNAQAVHKETVAIPYSSVKHHIADILMDKGFVALVEKKERKMAHPALVVTLKYDDKGRGAISYMQRISKPGRRIYTKKDDMKRVHGGHSIGIISTSHGLMTVEDAKRKGVGGEIICEVW